MNATLECKNLDLFEVPQKNSHARIARVGLWIGIIAAIVLLTEIHVHKGKLVALFYISAVLLAWYAFLPKPDLAIRLLSFELGLTAFFLVAVYYMSWVAAATFPARYDDILARLDARWLFNAGICRRLIESSRVAREATSFVYLGMKNMTIFWYGWHVATNAQPKKFFGSLLLAYLIGPLFYLLAPAYGPHVLVGGGLPNCIPSLHMATALLIIVYRPKGGLIPALLFAVGTAFVTLATGHHYVIDLVVAVPFTGFVWAAIERRWIVASSMFGIVLGVITAIHLMA